MSLKYTQNERQLINDAWHALTTWADRHADLRADVERAMRLERQDEHAPGNYITAARVCVVSEVHDALMNWNVAMPPSRLKMRIGLIYIFVSVSFWLNGLQEHEVELRRVEAMKLCDVLRKAVNANRRALTRMVADDAKAIEELEK